MSKDPWDAVVPEPCPTAEDEPDEATIEIADNELEIAFGTRDAVNKRFDIDPEDNHLNVRQHGNF